MSIAKTDGTAGTCTECWCLVEQGMERAHEDWHEGQKMVHANILRAATHALADASALRAKIREMEGQAP